MILGTLNNGLTLLNVSSFWQDVTKVWCCCLRLALTRRASVHNTEVVSSRKGNRPMPERIAFRMNLNPGQAAKYKKRHDEIWPELSQALRDAGVSDYSIWLDEETNHLFATLVRTDDHSMDQLPRTEINRRWWDFMADVMEYNAKNEPVVVPLRNVFHMD